MHPNESQVMSATYSVKAVIENNQEFSGELAPRLYDVDCTCRLMYIFILNNMVMKYSKPL
jgi:hypothetical protein